MRSDQSTLGSPLRAGSKLTSLGKYTWWDPFLGVGWAHSILSSQLRNRFTGERTLLSPLSRGWSQVCSSSPTEDGPGVCPGAETDTTAPGPEPRQLSDFRGLTLWYIVTVSQCYNVIVLHCVSHFHIVIVTFCVKNLPRKRHDFFSSPNPN